MKTKKEVFISLASELVADGFGYSEAIQAVARLSPSLMQVVKANIFSSEAHEIYIELKRRHPEAA